ncbi:major facilitator superfamily transporter [Colletotrichum incanum]|uniref:Major facilitator superfamily transporter n=1 Tax=Colletotrichum incanum TaxID=1573173 RepID=A0A161WHP9_COLIC|nr:major facilitator superfamily transporter [Colletotrichum incanum]
MPLHRRPQLTAAVSIGDGISQCITITIGGIFVDKPTCWRWCIWINLPIDDITFFVLLFLLKLPPQAKIRAQGLRKFLQDLGIFGTLLLSPWTICLLLALQRGGTEYQWSSWRIILCWCVFAMCFVLRGFVQSQVQDEVTVPFRIVFQRLTARSCWLVLLLFSLFSTKLYYVTIWPQAVEKTPRVFLGSNNSIYDNARTIPTRSHQKPKNTSVGSGLIFSFKKSTSTGFCSRYLSMIFLQGLGGTIFLAVSENIFTRKIYFRAIPQRSGPVVNDPGASGIVGSMRRIYPNSVNSLIGAYNKALQTMFLIAILLGCLKFIGCFFIE